MKLYGITIGIILLFSSSIFAQVVLDSKTEKVL